MVTARRVTARAVLLGWLLLLVVATTYGLQRARLYLLDDELAGPVLLVGLLLAMLLGQLVIGPTSRSVRNRSCSPSRSVRSVAAIFPGQAPGTPAACPFSLSPIAPDSGR